MYKIGFGAMKNGYFKREELCLSSPKLEKLIAYYKNTDVYTGCYIYTDTGLLYGDFYLDFDCELNEQNFLSFKEDVLGIYDDIQDDFHLSHEHMQLYFSGAKGFHLIVPACNMGCSISDDLNEQFKKIAMYYKKRSAYIDSKIYDTRRVLRIPNSVNSKTNLYKIPISYDELTLLDYASLCLKASAPQKAMKMKYMASPHAQKNKKNEIISKINNEEKSLYSMQKKTFDRNLLNEDVIFPCMYRMLEDIHHKGSRNEVLVVIASHLFQKGVGFDEVLSYLSSWNQTHFDPPIKNAEFMVTLRSVYSHFSRGRRYGCQSILKLGYCDFNCSFDFKNRG